MASIGSFYIGGRELNISECNMSESSVVYKLQSPAEKTAIWQTDDGNWIVSISQGSENAIARSRHRRKFEETHSHGLQAIQKALDIFSVQKNITVSLNRIDDTYLVLYYDGKLILRYVAFLNLKISMEATVEIRDKEGKIIKQPEMVQPAWHKSFRYYRLSQLASDVYEAYRNLYLSFESLLFDIVPKNNNEREEKWVRRGLTVIHNQHNLSAFVPHNHNNPPEYLFGRLYKHMRCSLFHAKEAGAILPFYKEDPTKVREAYENLLRLWQFIANKYLNTSLAGGVITYVGYKTWMDGIFSKNICVAVTDDNSLPADSDITLSPLRRRVVNLSNSIYTGEVTPGIVGIEAYETNIDNIPLVHRIGLLLDDTLYAVSFVKEELRVNGVDKFEVIMYQRLIQGNQPRTLFYG